MADEPEPRPVPVARPITPDEARRLRRAAWERARAEARAEAKERAREAEAVAAFVVGLAGCACGCVWFAGIGAGILAIVMGLRTLGSRRHGLAVAGICLGVAALVTGAGIGFLILTDSVPGAEH